MADGYGGFVAGSMGPGTKSPSLGQIGFAELRDAYEEMAHGLIEGGVDLLITETHFDLLAVKAAMIGARRAMASLGKQVPLQVQVTMEQTGTMLLGSEIGAALGAIEPLRPDIFGLNCATGPGEMSEHLRHLSAYAQQPISCLPNMGLPSVVDGKMHYDLDPETFVDYQTRFVTELGVQVVGGCCGSSPEHIRQLAAVAKDLTPASRQVTREPGATSMFSFVPFHQDASFLIIGERTNANGSRKFRDTMLAADWDSCVKIARDQEKEGAHVLDVCVDYVGRDGTLDMDELVSRYATQVTVPLVLDSTEPQVLEAGLQRLGGRAILNSANLEDGEAEGSRFDRVCSLAREYGAAVICLLIDEEGQARDVEWKLRVAHRIHDLATTRYGLAPSDLIFDALTFPLSTGDDDLRHDAMNTIEAIRRIKAELPGVYTTLGVSNVSFGLSPAARHVLNSVFLHECVEAGLDSAIVHAARIMPLNKIPEDQLKVCLDLVYDRRDAATGYDPLAELLDVFADVTVAKAEKEDRSGWAVEERLKHRIIDGDRDGLTAELDEAMAGGLPPLAIINDVLLSGMKVVGELFGSGQMQLPFVLQSAETMKAAVAHLEPHMDAADAGAGKGRIVLATVKGDVHDIGKNLVDIILTNNGYEVHNLGIKIAIGDMIEKAKEVKADAIGMSGLLVKSTLIMRDNLQELNSRELSEIPILLGGAALTRSYVERDLRDIYEGRVFYGKDAFEGLRVMDKLGAIRRGDEADDPDWGRVPSESRVPSRASLGLGEKEEVDPSTLPTRSPDVVDDNEVFIPPFVGSQVVKGIPLDDIAGFLNETALFRNQWQFRPEKGENDEEFKAAAAAHVPQRAGQGQGRGPAGPAAGLRLLPGQQRRQRPGHLDRRAAHRGAHALPVPAPDQGAVPVHRRLLPAGRQRRGRLRGLLDRDDGPGGVGEDGQAVRRRPLPGVPAAPRARRRDGGGAGRVLAPPHARGVGLRLGGRANLAGLFRQQYRGGRYSWGYPACPDLEDNVTVMKLLEGERIGLVCGEDTGYQYQPEQTTSALVCHHPQAKYFVVR